MWSEIDFIMKSGFRGKRQGERGNWDREKQRERGENDKDGERTTEKERERKKSEMFCSYYSSHCCLLCLGTFCSGQRGFGIWPPFSPLPPSLETRAIRGTAGPGKACMSTLGSRETKTPTTGPSVSRCQPGWSAWPEAPSIPCVRPTTTNSWAHTLSCAHPARAMQGWRPSHHLRSLHSNLSVFLWKLLGHFKNKYNLISMLTPALKDNSFT